LQNAIPKISPPAAKEISSLIERSRVLIGQGNIAGARRVLERAALARSGEALLRLAKTYDPAVLARWGAFGVKPDREKARELYRQAAELGASDAPETTASLGPTASTSAPR
jgi:TPR repeat protein